MNSFLAGAAQVDITPPLGTIINGEFVAFYAHTIHDPLYSKALVLQNADTILAVVIVDICAMDKEFISQVKNQITALTGIVAENILIAATHTHYAGSILDLLGGPCDLAYRKSLSGKIVQSVMDAMQRLSPARIGFASVNVPEHVVCRRYYMRPGYKALNPVTGGLDIIKTNPAGDESYIDRRASVVDPELSAIAVQSVGGEWVGLLANYSMHYVGDCRNGTVSADYFGVFARYIAVNLNAGENFVAMLSNGTSGEANIWDFLQPGRYPEGEHEKKELIGKDLARKLAGALNDIEWQENPALAGALQFVTLGVRKPSVAEVEAAKKIVAQTDYRLINPLLPESMPKIYAREQVLLNEYPDTIEFPIQALKIGNISIGALGGEFFAETGLSLKQQIATGKHFTITMANDYTGYIPPAHEIQKGGYETWRCRSSHVKEEGESVIRKRILALIHSLFTEKRKCITGCILFIMLVVCSCTGPRKFSYNTGADTINHIVHMGQSLGAGEQSLPVVTDTATGYGNFRFAMGTHTWTANKHPDKPELRDAAGFSFVPLTAVQRGAEGETIASGLCDHLTETTRKLHTKELHFLFSYAGQGGRYLRELDKLHDDAKDPRAGNRRSGGGYYSTSMDDVKRAKRTADSLRMRYSVFAVTWMQGEANAAGKMNRWDSALTLSQAIETYKEDLVRLKNDYQKDIRFITGQKKAIPFFTYQTAGNLAGMAQIEACDEQKDMFMVGPTYMLPNAENSHYFSRDKLVHGDGIHLTADGERWLGELFGKVMRKVVIEGKNWQPLRPVKAWYKKAEHAVFIRFHVPEPPVVIDTGFLPKQEESLGFSIYNDKSGKYVIRKVEVVEKDLLKISLAAPADGAAPSLVSYGLLSKAADISQPVKAVRYGVKGKDGHESIEIIFEGNILNEVAILGNEGVFYLNNLIKDNENFTNLIIRETFLDGKGNTVFRGEADDLRNNINFLPGQRCYTSRRFSYGNIRDADQEKSTFCFKDAMYGKRRGEPYPLYNWCIAFDNLKIEPL